MSTSDSCLTSWSSDEVDGGGGVGVAPPKGTRRRTGRRRRRRPRRSDRGSDDKGYSEWANPRPTGLNRPSQSKHAHSADGSAARSGDAMLPEATRRRQDMIHAQREFQKAANDASGNKKLATYYKYQSMLVESFLNVDPSKPVDLSAEEQSDGCGIKLCVNLSFIVNVTLLIVKVYVAIRTGSLSVIASAVDSVLDFMSGCIIFGTAYAISKRNPYKYPAGKRRLEPLGIIIFACVMGTAALQLFIECIQTIAGGDPEVELDVATFIVFGYTLLSKIFLYFLCRTVKDSLIVEALTTDHRNDIIANAIGICTAVIGAEWVWWIDPVGGAVLAIFIIRTWVETGYEQLVALAGRSAPDEFLKQITYMAMQHYEDSRVDTVRAYHTGLYYLVECDIVLDPRMDLQTAHDIGEDLMMRIEELDDVERAFVHLDYEVEHKPEHKPL